MKGYLKNILLKHSWIVNYFPFNNCLCFSGAKIRTKRSLVFRSKVKKSGRNNMVSIEEGSVCYNCTFVFRGNNNLVSVGENVYARNTEFWIEDDGNQIVIDKNSSLCGEIHLSCIEGTSIYIGEDCLFSSDIVIRTGDSHSILSLEGSRINRSENITISNRVWIGHRVLIGKGVKLPEDTIVATGAIVTKSFKEANTVLAGIPAKVVKNHVKWEKQRLPMESEK